jgi:uncharacterized protein YuzE
VVAFGFRPPVYHLACRDQWIGWGIGARAQNRGRVIGLSRFLLRPGLRVPNLASQCYGRILRQVGRDAEANLKALEIAREDAETAIRTPARREAARPPREIVTRPYFDKVTAGRNNMKVEYDPQTDTLTITLRDARIRESGEVRPGVIADFGYDGGVVRFAVLDASKVVDRTREMQFALADG